MAAMMTTASVTTAPKHPFKPRDTMIAVGDLPAVAHTGTGCWRTGESRRYSRRSRRSRTVLTTATTTTTTDNGTHNTSHCFSKIVTVHGRMLSFRPGNHRLRASYTRGWISGAGPCGLPRVGKAAKYHRPPPGRPLLHLHPRLGPPKPTASPVLPLYLIDPRGRRRQRGRASSGPLLV